RCVRQFRPAVSPCPAPAQDGQSRKLNAARRPRRRLRADRVAAQARSRLRIARARGLTHVLGRSRMDNPTSLLFFALFGIILFVMYIAVRRRWASPLVIAAIGVVASIVVITLMSLSEGNHIYQALFVGLLVGGLFSAGTL